MEKLRKFETEEEFLNIKNSLGYPQVSLTDDNGKVWIGEEQSYIICTYMVDDIENPIELIYHDEVSETIFEGMFIDGGEYINLSNRVSPYTFGNSPILYQFDTIGIHSVKFMMKSLPYGISFYEKSTFKNNSNLINIDLSNLRDTSNITNMERMFESDYNLISITFGDNFDTSNVTNMRNMFYECSGLTSLDLSSFDTSKVSIMERMFMGCSNLTSITFGDNWDTYNVTSLDRTFIGCSNLTSLDLSSWNTSNVTYMGKMFYGCSKLMFIIIGKNFITSNMGSYFTCDNDLNGLLVINNNPLDMDEVSSIIKNNQLLIDSLNDSWNHTFRKTLKFRLYDNFDKVNLITDVLNNDNNILPCISSYDIDYDNSSYSISLKDAYYDNNEECWVINDFNMNLNYLYLYDKNNIKINEESGDTTYEKLLHINEELILTNDIIDLYLGLGFD